MAVSNRNRLLEKYVEVVRMDGLNTNKNVNIGIAGAGSTATLSVGTGGINTSGALNSLEAVTPVTANTTLTAAQSAGTFAFNVAAGATVTLPAAAVGLTYTFVIQTTITSNNAKVTVGSSNGFLIGGLLESNAGALSTTADGVFTGNGSSHISVTQNGSTTGGVQGGMFTITCIFAGATPLWQVEGTLITTGTSATAFSAS